jgi:hypothetical protein
MLNKIKRSISYFIFGWTNEDYRFDNLIFLLRFKINRFILQESKKEFPDQKIIQVYRILLKLSHKYLFDDSPQDIKQKKIRLFFKIIQHYNESWYI